MLSYKISLVVLIMLLTSSFVGIPLQFVESDSFISINDEPTYDWNSNWKFHQKITPFIETTSDTALYQPIDILVKYNELCWAINESCNSIRVCVWDMKKWHELESEIYDMNFTDDSHISSCRLVFIIEKN